MQHQQIQEVFYQDKQYRKPQMNPMGNAQHEPPCQFPLAQHEANYRGEFLASNEYMQQDDYQELTRINRQEDERNQRQFKQKQNALFQQDPYANNRAPKRNPYINYDDKSIPNIAEMSKFSRNEEDSGTAFPVTESEIGEHDQQRPNRSTRNKFSSGREAELQEVLGKHEQQSSSAIYDQDQFVNEMSATKIFETANLGNQKYYYQMLAQIKQTQNEYLDNFQTQLENIKRDQNPRNDGQQRPSVIPGAVAASAAKPDIIKMAEEEFMQLMSLKNRIESNVVTYDRIWQQFMTQYQHDVKKKISEQIEKVQKYKQLCKKHYNRADSYKTKHLHHEFEMRNRIDQLESAMDRIGEQANNNEELRYQKHVMAQRYDQRMNKIEDAIKNINYKQVYQERNDFHNFSNNEYYDEFSDVEQQRLHNSLGRISRFENRNIGPERPNQNFILNQNAAGILNQMNNDIEMKLNKSYDEYAINLRKKNQNAFHIKHPKDSDHREQDIDLGVRRVKTKQKKTYKQNKANQFQSPAVIDNQQADRDHKRAIVQNEIDKLNDMIVQFKLEDENFLRKDQRGSNINSHEYQNLDEIQNYDQNLKSSTRNDNSNNEQSLQQMQSLDNFQESTNEMDQAFVEYNDAEEDVEPQQQGSPIFNMNRMNDTSGFFNNGNFDEDLNFNPPPSGPAGVMMKVKNDLNGQQQDQNQTIEFDVSFSKELALAIEENGENDFLRNDPNFRQRDEQQNNFINSIEKTNEIINMYNQKQNMFIDSNASASPLNEEAFLQKSKPTQHQPPKRRNKKSEKISNNNSINFSNIFSQINESNVFGGTENQDNCVPSNSILKQGSFSIDPMAPAAHQQQHQTNQVSPGFSEQKQINLNNQNDQNLFFDQVQDENDPVLFKLKFQPDPRKNQKEQKDFEQIDLSSIILAVSDHDQQLSPQKVANFSATVNEGQKPAHDQAFEMKKNKTHQKNLFNTTMKISEINQISAIKSMDNQQVNGQNAGDTELILGGGGLSSANSKFRDELKDLNTALNNGQNQEASGAGEVYNINISRDDAESIINLLKDYFTLKLGNGREIKIPRLNLAMLPNIFPPQIHEEIKQKISDKKGKNIITQLSANIKNFFQSNEFSDKNQKPIDQLFEEGFCISSKSPNINSMSEMSTQQKIQMQNQNTVSLVQKEAAQANKSSFQNTTTQEEPIETSGLDIPSIDVNSNKFHIQSDPQIQIHNMDLKNEKDDSQSINIIQSQNNNVNFQSHNDQFDHLQFGRHNLQENLRGAKGQPDSPKDFLINESPIMSNHDQRAYPYIDGGEFNMMEVNHLPNQHEAAQEIEAGANDNAIFIMDDTNNKSQFSNRLSNNMSNMQSPENFCKQNMMSNLVLKDVNQSNQINDDVNCKDNFDSIEGLEGLVNLSNILPNQTEIDNYDALDAQDAFTNNYQNQNQNQRHLKIQQDDQNALLYDNSNTYDLNDRVIDNLNSFENFNDSYNGIIGENSAFYSGSGEQNTAGGGALGFSGFLDLTNQGLPQDMEDDRFNNGQHIKLSDQEDAGLRIFQAPVLISGTQKLLWGPETAIQSSKNHFALDNLASNISMRSDKTGDQLKFKKYNSSKPSKKQKSSRPAIQGSKSKKGGQQNQSNKQNYNIADKSHRSSHRISQRNSQINQNKTRSSKRTSERSKNRNFRETNQQINNSKNHENQRIQMNQQNQNFNLQDKVSDNANLTQNEQAIYEFENVQQAIIGVGVGICLQSHQVTSTASIGPAAANAQRQVVSKSSLNQQNQSIHKGHDQLSDNEPSQGMPNHLRGGYQSFKSQKVEKKDQNREIICKAAKFLDENDESNVSVNVSLKNKALNYQNDSIFNDKEYKNDMNQIYAIDQFGGFNGKKLSYQSIQANSIKNNCSRPNSSKFTAGSKSVRSSQTSNKNGQNMQIGKQMSDYRRQDQRNKKKVISTKESKEQKQSKKINNIQHLINKSKNKRLLETKLKSSVAKEPTQQIQENEILNFEKTKSPANKGQENCNIDPRKAQEDNAQNQIINHHKKSNEQVAILGKVVKKKKKIDRVQASNSVPAASSKQMANHIEARDDPVGQNNLQKILTSNLIRLQKKSNNNQQTNTIQLVVPGEHDRQYDQSKIKDMIHAGNSSNDKNHQIVQVMKMKPKIKIASREPSKESQRSFKSQVANIKKIKDSQSNNQSTQKRDMNTEAGQYTSSAGAATAFDSENYRANALIDNNSQNNQSQHPQSSQNIKQIKKALLINHLLKQQQRLNINSAKSKQTDGQSHDEQQLVMQQSTPFTPAQISTQQNGNTASDIMHLMKDNDGKQPNLIEYNSHQLQSQVSRSQVSVASKVSKLSSRASNPQIHNFIQNPLESKILSRNSSTGAGDIGIINPKIQGQNSAVSSILSKKLDAQNMRGMGNKIILKSNQINLNKASAEKLQQTGQQRAKSTRAVGITSAGPNIMNFKGMKINFKKKPNQKANDSRQHIDGVDQSITHSIAINNHQQTGAQNQNQGQDINNQQIGATTIISGSSSLPKRKKLNLNQNNTNIKIQMKKSNRADGEEQKSNYFEQRGYKNDNLVHNSMMLIQSNQEAKEGLQAYMNNQDQRQQMIYQQNQSIALSQQTNNISQYKYSTANHYQGGNDDNMLLADMDSTGFEDDQQNAGLTGEKGNNDADAFWLAQQVPGRSSQVSQQAAQSVQSSQRMRPQSLKGGAAARPQQTINSSEVSHQTRGPSHKSADKNHKTLKVNPLNLKLSKNLQNKRLVTLQKENSQLSSQSRSNSLQQEHQAKKIPQKNK